MPRKHTSRKSKSRCGGRPTKGNNLCRSQTSDVNNSLTPGATTVPTNYSTMDSCRPSTTTDDYLKAACGDLYQTISTGNSDDVIQMIESSNAEHNYFDQTTLDRGLLMASDRGRKVIVLHLILKGASINTKDPLGYTPLQLAVERGFIEIARILLSKGADVNASNMRGDSALTLSVRTCGSKDMVSLLLEQTSVDVNHRNNDGYTCWMKAVEALDFDTLRLLVKSGKEVNKDINGFKEPTSINASTASLTKRLDTPTFNVNDIISFLEREAKGVNNSLRLAVFERDLNSVRCLIDYGIVDDQIYKNATLLIEFMEDIERKPSERFPVSENELEIIRKLLTTAAEFYLTSSYRAERVLVVAVNIGSCELVELLCQRVVISDTRQVTTQYTKAIIAVAEKGRCDLLKVLINYAKTYNCFDLVRLSSAIVTALASGNVNVVKIFIKNGVTFDVASSLNIAATHKRLNSLRFLISKFSDVCRPVILNNRKGLFHGAVELGDIDIINILLDLGSDVNRLYQGETPLMKAQTPEVMELLIRRGAEVKQAEIKNRVSLLSYFIVRDFRKYWPRTLARKQEEDAEKSSTHLNLKEMIEILLRNGANVNGTDSIGQTPLMAAAQQTDCRNVLKVLLEAGADVNKSDCEGVTALQQAVNTGCLKNVEILIEAGAEVNQKSYGGSTVLHEAIKNEEILKCLLQHGADVDAEDASGNSALFLAVISSRSYKENSFAVLRILLEFGSNVNHRNAIGETALMKAASSRNNAVIKLLCEADADVRMRSLDNKHDVISILVDRLYHATITCGDVRDSLFYLIDRGASSSCVSLQNLYYFIMNGCLTIVQRLVEAGLGPSDIVARHLEVKYKDPLRTKKISPFCFALLCNQVTLARYFSEIWYLTNSDVSTLAQDKDVRRHLTSQRHKESLAFLEEFSSQPISLQKLSFVAVSTSIGTGPDRELKIRGLPVPNMFKDKLLFITGCGQRLQFDDKQQSLVSFPKSVLYDIDYDHIYDRDSSVDVDDFDYAYDYNYDSDSDF